MKAMNKNKKSFVDYQANQPRPKKEAVKGNTAIKDERKVSKTPPKVVKATTPAPKNPLPKTTKSGAPQSKTNVIPTESATPNGRKE